MKKFLPLFFIMLLGITSFAQDCYNSTRNKAIDLFNQGKKSQAKSFFEAAKDCPDKPTNNDLNTWIKKCDSGVNPKTEKITIESIALVDPSGLTSALTNANYYTDELSSFSPKLIINNGNKSSKKSKISITVIDPENKTLRSSVSSQYTETKEITLKPGYNEVLFSALNSFSHTPLVGTYTCKIWIDNKQAKETTWMVSVRPTILAINGKTDDFEVTLDCNAGSHTFSVSTNAESFEVRHKPSWVSIETSQDNSFTITHTSNPSNTKREGIMDIYTSNGERSLYIKLVQDGNPALADRFGSRMFKDMKMKVGLGFCLPNFSAKASSELGSVIDYGVTDVSSLAYLEKPNYKTLTGFSMAFSIDLPLTKTIFIETGLGFQFFGVKNVFSNDQLKYTVSGTSYYMDYGCTERYTMSYLQIPVLAGYRLRLNSVSSLRFNVGFDFGIGLSAKCSLEGGYSNYTYSDGNYSYYGNSTYSGWVKLYSGRYEIHQQYSTGQSPSYTYSGQKSAPYNRFNLGLHLGAAYDFGSLEAGISYTIGLSNIGNKHYFGSTNRVGGCLFAGDVISSEQGINNYKQHVNSFQIFVNYWL